METVLVTQIGQAQRITSRTVVDYPTLDALWSAYRTKKGVSITIVKSIGFTTTEPSVCELDEHNAKSATWQVPVLAQVVTQRVDIDKINNIIVEGVNSYSFGGVVTRRGARDTEYYDEYIVEYEQKSEQGQEVTDVTYGIKKNIAQYRNRSPMRDRA